MLPIILASQLWFINYQAVLNGQDMNARPLPFGNYAHATKAECVKDGQTSVKEFTAHNPFPGAKWSYTCTRKLIPRAKTQAELDAIHNGHVGH